MELRESNGIQYYIFNSFERTGLVKHCFTTRNGGVSDGCFSSMNLWFKHGDDANVIDNYRLICDAVGLSPDSLVLSDQVHETCIYFPGYADRGKGITRESDIKETDGFITDQKGVAMVTVYADCVPLFFLDPVKKVAALSHAGWKGTLKEIGVKTVSEMRRRYDCSPGDILVGIGPSIGPCCFEVDESVSEAFSHIIYYSREFIKRNTSSDQNESKYMIDLWAVNKKALLMTGIPPENIETAGLCTVCNPELFYSHRRMGVDRGAMAAIMELTE